MNAHKEVIRLIREEFDPTPPNWGGSDWNDNAEEVANKIVAVAQAQMPAHVGEAWRVINQWLVGFAEEEASFSRYADNALIDGVLPAGTVREMARLLAGDGERP